jgi:saccharopine dehydrogenase-like NADP-dependent oxidoreductase
MTARIYIIGAGEIAAEHIKAIQRLPDPVDLAIADPLPVARNRFADRAGVRLFDDTTRMLAEPAGTNDIVIVATPPFLHSTHAALALQTGRHVLCEKPHKSPYGTSSHGENSPCPKTSTAGSDSTLPPSTRWPTSRPPRRIIVACWTCRPE